MPGSEDTAGSPVARPLSANSNLSAINDTLSPVDCAKSPSPPSGVAQQLPPACGARQLSKLKRFLTTLQQFGADISPEIGDRVRSLVLALVNNHMTIEDFHTQLQETTNFPLRPFVIPFLKANLPLLQRELLHCAHIARQTPQQYLARNEGLLFEQGGLLKCELNENGKRLHNDSSSFKPYSRPAENGGFEGELPPKRPHYSATPIRLEDLSRDLRERERIDEQRLFPGVPGLQRTDPFERPSDRLDDDWKHVDNMLQCLAQMVEKTRCALSALQERQQRQRHEFLSRARKQADVNKKRDDEKRPGGLFPEEALNEVKRQAVAELQKAVAAAEVKAHEMVAAERTRMELVLTDTRKQIQQELLASLNHQEESSESCWNCGRKASETCSGCNLARYCGAFCQHKDWESHHRVCGKTNKLNSPKTDAKNTSDLNQ